MTSTDKGAEAMKNRLRRAYLVRCWLEEEPVPGEEPRWRFSVEQVLNQQPRRGFDSLETLIAFLRAELTGGGDELSS